MTKNIIKLLSIFVLLTSLITFLIYPSLKYAHVYTDFIDYTDIAYIEFPEFSYQTRLYIGSNNDSTNWVKINTTVSSSNLKYDSYKVVMSMPIYINGAKYNNVMDYIDHSSSANLWEQSVTMTDFMLGDYGGYFPTEFADIFQSNAMKDKIKSIKHNHIRALAESVNVSFFDELIRGASSLDNSMRIWDDINAEINSLYSRYSSLFSTLPFFSCDLTTYIGTPYVHNYGDYVDIRYTFKNIKVLPNGISMLNALSCLSSYFNESRPQLSEWTDIDSPTDFFKFFAGNISYPFKWIVFSAKNINYVYSSFTCFL